MRNETLNLARQDVHPDGVNVLSQHLNDKLMQLSSSILSCASCLQSTTVARVLHALSKLKFFQKELYEALCEHFDFEFANAKTLSMVLGSLARHPEPLEHIQQDFVINLCESIIATLPTTVPYDLTIYATSIPKLILQFQGTLETKATQVNKKFGVNNLVSCLRAVYESVLDRATETIETDESGFKSFEFVSVLTSTYDMGFCNVSIKTALADRFKSMVYTSPNGISEALKLLSSIPSPAYVKENIRNRGLRQDMVRFDKEFAEWMLGYLEDHLDSITTSELVSIASSCNRLRLWSTDTFVIKFAKSCYKSLGEELVPQSLSQLLCYFLRRYEASVNREVSYQKSDGDLDTLQFLSNVSDTCANMGDILYRYAKDRFNNEEMNKIDKTVKIADFVRAKRSFGLSKLYNN